MRFLLAVLLIMVFSFLAGIFLPWWSLAIVAFLVALLLVQRILFSFLAGFTGIFLLWAILSFWIDLKNEHILSQKIALIFPLGGSSVLLILVTAFVGALVGGFAAMAGSSIRPAVRKSV
ncbi:MAG: hypothetical protein ACO1OO_10035 [Flavisolibacter sp.]